MASWRFQAHKDGAEAADREAGLLEAKATLEFQVQEAEVKLEEAGAALKSLAARHSKLQQEAESSNKYQQEIEGA